MARCSTQRLLAPETFVLVELDRTGRIVNSYFIIFHHISCASNFQCRFRAGQSYSKKISCLIAVAATIVYFHQFSGESGKKWILPAANFRAKKRLTLLNTLIICIRYCTVYKFKKHCFASFLHHLWLYDICKILVCCWHWNKTPDRSRSSEFRDGRLHRICTSHVQSDITLAMAAGGLM